MWFSVLGPLQVRDDRGQPVAAGGPRLRALLSLLLLRAGTRVSREALAEAVWPDRDRLPPPNALQALVSRLRRTLGASVTVDGDGTGYRLDVEPCRVDLHEYERLARSGRSLLKEDDRDGAEHELSRARALWRGRPLPDLTVRGVAEETVLRLESLHRTVVEDHLAAALARDPAGVLPEAEALAAEDPYRERPVELLVRSLAAQGRGAEALAAYTRFTERLADELGLDPSPHLQDLHLRLLRGELAPRPDQGPARPRTERNEGHHTRFPVPLTSFVPREEELGAVRELLTHARLVTLTGPGGAGKTRLAVEAAAALTEDGDAPVEDGAWFVELAASADGDDLVDTLAENLGVREGGRLHPRVGPVAPPPLERITAFLADRSALLVLDNCEHLLDAASGTVRDLLARCPGLRILTTSRAPLEVPGERLLPVPPLALPPPGSGAAEAQGFASVALFADRARAARPDFAVTADNAEHVVRIVRELDGIPLALELAAARMRSMGPAHLAVRLGDRFRLLAGPHRTALPRHRTLRAVVDWSWDLLGPAERRLLTRLSVLPGGASLAAVERVCADPGTTEVEGVDVWEALFALVDQSLVVADADTADPEQPRYRLLETVRAYAGERLAESGEAVLIRTAHARYVRDLWREADAGLRGPRQAALLASLADEAGGFGPALRWAVDSGDADLALDLIEHGQWYWTVRGEWELLARWSSQVYASFEGRIPQGRAVAHACCLLHRASACLDPDPVHAGELVAGIDSVLAAEGRTAEYHPVLVNALLHAALVAPEESEYERRMSAVLDRDDPWMRASTEVMLALTDVVNGRAARALDRSVRAWRTFRELGDPWGRCQALAQAADLYRFSDLARARTLLAEGRRVAEETGLHGMAAVLGLREVQLALDAGEPGTARAGLEVLTPVTEHLDRDHRVLWAMAQVQAAREEGDLGSAMDLIEHHHDGIIGLAGFFWAYVGPGWWALTATVHQRAGRTEQALEAIGRAWWSGPPRQTPGPIGAETVGVLAGIVCDTRPERAALLLGYGEALRGLPDLTGPDAVRAGEHARRALGRERYEQLLARGRGAGPARIRADVDAWLAHSVPHGGPRRPSGPGTNAPASAEGQGPGRAQVRRR
ncbi:SARP family transcriptional regulator [Nocardiopsis kunsanensis]|uniref:SARP family transcriptional regulator n=1 Tax=Nocardiopsis kunsanensis TaxID=141693 RepID=A0A918XFJ8_9ACTN|nr:BTAD domain-containing putative transcriptional regulator [Nocardiopsis kunsanensis]GHD28366.1 SARP family transcriptional regulator [Nocardiopsis kunsanensis]